MTAEVGMDDLELTKACALAMGWKHLGAVGVPAIDRGNGNAPGEFWCLSGGNDWWIAPEGDRVCGPCQGIPDPLHDDAQCFTLVKQFRIACVPYSGLWECSIAGPSQTCKAYASDANLNRAICLVTARLAPGAR